MRRRSGSSRWRRPDAMARLRRSSWGWGALARWGGNQPSSRRREVKPAPEQRVRSCRRDNRAKRDLRDLWGYPKTAHLQAESLKRCKPDPPMPDQEQLDDFLEALETAGSPAKNPSLCGVMNGQGPPRPAKLSALSDRSTRGPNHD